MVRLLVIRLVLSALALVLAGRRGRLAELLLVCLAALLFAVFYVLLPAFTTLRFVLPVFALLAVPVAAALVDLLIASRRIWRRLLVALTTAALVTHLALMLPTA